MLGLALFEARAGLVPLEGVEQIAVGDWHSCALSEAGAVTCWGRNDRGQLGDGTLVDRSAPVEVAGLQAGVVAIAAGEEHSCAVRESGSVVCWGSNLLGQLGSGSQGIAPVTTPVAVVGLGGAASLALGGSHSCARLENAQLWCWGSSEFGQLGLNGGQHPTASLRLSGVDEVATGDAHTCVRQGGAVSCMGYALFGQLGRADRDEFSGYPTAAVVDGLGAGVAAIGAGRNHSCAALQGGGLRCWGNHEGRQIGNGGEALRYFTPQEVLGLSSSIAAVDGGDDFSCALEVAGGLRCWGRNDQGQIGTGDALQVYPLAESVPLLASGVRSIGAGRQHACALTLQGAVLCWGGNGHGQLGIGRTDPLQRDEPVMVAGLGTAQSIGSGVAHSCAVSTTGALLCWGANAAGQLGDGTTTRRFTATPVVGLGSGVLAMAGGESHSCALSAGGALHCWGENRFAQLATGSSQLQALTPVSLSGLYSPSGFSQPVSALSAGGVNTCGLVGAQGRVGCWGFPPLGRADRPVFLLGLIEGIAAVTSGAAHHCALTATGVVRCWGAGDRGQLVNGFVDSPSATVEIEDIGEVVKRIASGREHSCAATVSDRVVCWGSDDSGEGGTLGPITVNGTSGSVRALAAGRRHNCMLSEAGAVSCWGDNEFGQLGNGGAPAPARTAVAVTGLSSGVLALSAGDFHTCALLSGGGVACWGFNGAGQLGDGRLPGGVGQPSAVLVDPAFFRSGFEEGEAG